MKTQGLIAILGSITIITGAQASRSVDQLGSEFRPYTSQEQYQLSEREFADLKAYVDQAKEVLLDLVEQSRGMSGAAKHAFVREGMISALGHAEMSDDFLLFRHILNRALELDAVFTRVSNGEDVLVAATDYILLGGVRLALHYRENADRPRMIAPLVPVPDWTRFASDQIPILLRSADLAPTNSAKVEVLRRALEWTIRSLNSDVMGRRKSEIASMIFRLARVHRQLRSGSNLRGGIDQAQSLLLKTRNKLPGEDAYDRSGITSVAPAGGLKGRTNHTLSDGNRFRSERGSRGIWRSLDDSLRSVGGDLNQTRSCNKYGNKCTSTRGMIELGVGAEFSESRDAKVRPAGLIDLFMGVVFHSDVKGPPAFATLDARGHAGVSLDGVPVYSVQVNASAAFMGIFGVWVAIEANQFDEIRELRGELTFGPTIMVEIGDTSYVLVRSGVGVAGEVGSAPYDAWGLDVQDTSGFGQTSTQVALKLARFLVRIEYSYDWSCDGECSNQNLELNRHAFAASLSIPLGLIFGNDAIRIEGKSIAYRASSDHEIGSTGSNNAKVNASTFGAFYTGKW